MTYRTDENSNLVKVETMYSEEYVEYLQKKITVSNIVNEYMSDLIDERDDKIERLNDESYDKWISVKDRLPEDGSGDVLVFIVCHFDNGLSGIDIGAYFTQKDAWAYADNTAHEYNPMRTSVTHWMEIPNKPKDNI